MKVRVTVMLKEGVLDPQGKAIDHALQTLGFPGVSDVRVGKIIELDVASTDRAAITKQAEEMASNLLANMVIEDFSVEVLA
ncbi:phosphoribosylformylglycinamidine synthase [Acetobacter orientalis]|uniref:phosphoribosylformylglycinamidine synthase subunit PurS n=1 Tax=Acetobacter orientalis TaxID=146474 RepID=UPI000A363094|nr:phosphoribosylformylglycinamidine synthase subunit PurS [Acetobacter orientalis]OUJ17699.1 phosphoribosylformylglycinamidine synthase [Acetobacter orientalis]